MLNDSDERVLRSLDPADHTLSPKQQRHAEQLLERLIATPLPSDDIKSARLGRHPNWVRKVAWIAAAAACVGIASVVLPGVAGSGISYASWTTTPSPVSSADLGVVAAACRDKVRDARTGPNGTGMFNPDTIPVELAERRGDFVAVLFLQDNPQTSLTCVATNPPGSTNVDNLNASVGGGGPAWTPPPGQISPASVSQFGGHNPAAFTDGTVGANVVTVTIHAGSTNVTATVKNGRYVAWWPGTAFTTGPLQPNGQDGPHEILTYDLTLADGTVKSNVTPAIPQ